ncbi:unnamed protein product [Rotaria sordida]|uniref:Uncharacterized protein n=1 Tax=Rotaria sordida TaxID=392033 RepID=A0A815A5D6_9BILA|nr:unnamed protein product [Rotaria sordida]
MITQNNYVPSVVLMEIDDWERTTIEKVKTVAEQARQQLIKLPKSKKVETESRFEKFCQDLISLKETGDFVEHDLKYLQQTVDQLHQDLKRLTESFELELCTEQSNQIKWDTLIYIKEKPTYTECLQPQVNEKNQTILQVTLDCHGHTCPKCNKCCDWKNRVKRGDATCYRAGVGPGHMGYCDCVGHCHCGYNGYNYHPYSDVCCCMENK